MFDKRIHKQFEKTVGGRDRQRHIIQPLLINHPSFSYCRGERVYVNLFEIAIIQFRNGLLSHTHTNSVIISPQGL